MDDRIKKLSNLLVNYSTSVQPGEKVLINYEGRETLPLIRQLIKDIYKVGGLPYVESSESSVTREILLGASTEQIEMYSKHQLEFMKEMMLTLASEEVPIHRSYQMFHHLSSICITPLLSLS